MQVKIIKFELTQLSNSVAYFELLNNKYVGYFGFNYHSRVIEFANFLRRNGYDKIEIRKASRLTAGLRYEIKVSNCDIDFIRLVAENNMNIDRIESSLSESKAVKVINSFKSNAICLTQKVADKISSRFDFNKHSESFQFESSFV